jgi:DNA-binding NtrC family response regulator
MTTQARSPHQLAMIEFHTAGQTGAGGIERWLEGSSQPIERLRVQALQLSGETSPLIVVEGEPGSGKLRVAQFLHRASARSASTLMVLDAADPSVDAQINAVISQMRSNTAASAGTLAIRNFHLAEPGAVQSLLELVTLQGDGRELCTILLTPEPMSNLRARNLQSGQLLGRATRHVLRMPAMRERLGDLPLLARRFMDEALSRYGRRVRGISPQAISLLEKYDYPGNIHELRTIIEQAVIRCQGDWITVEHLGGLQTKQQVAQPESSELVIRLPGSSLREIEIAALKLALKISGGRVVRAAELLGITRHALRRKLEKFGLNDLRMRYDNSDNIPNLGPGPDPLNG